MIDGRIESVTPSDSEPIRLKRMNPCQTTSTYGGKVTMINSAAVDSLFAKNGTRFEYNECKLAVVFRLS